MDGGNLLQWKFSYGTSRLPRIHFEKPSSYVLKTYFLFNEVILFTLYVCSQSQSLTESAVVMFFRMFHFFKIIQTVYKAVELRPKGELKTTD
jgi:hypothetical protein